MNNRFFKAVFLVFLTLSVFLLSSCNSRKPKENRFYLSDGWEYSELGEPYPFYELPDQNLEKLSSLLEKRVGYIFLKNSFELPVTLRHQEIYLFIGRIKVSAKVYMNGHLLGQIGSLPPFEFSDGENSTCLKIPTEYINYSSPNTLTITVWCNDYGTIKSTPFISNYDDVIHKVEIENLKNSKIYMIFSVVLFIIFLIYLFIFFIRPSELQFLSFSQLCFATSLYLVTFYIGEYSNLYKNTISFLTFEKIFNGMAPLFTAYFVINFTRDFLDYKEKTAGKVLRVLLTALAIALPMFGANIVQFRSLLRIGFLIMILHFIYPTYIIIKSIRQKDKLVIKFILCFVPIYLNLIGYAFARIVLKAPSNILILSIGWLCVIFLFLGQLIYNFVTMAGKVEYMNKNLEKLVEERTVALKKEKERALTEIELAAFVQQSFLKLDTSNISDWELNYFSRPMSGVSGDLYLAFKSEKTLEGIGIFDISGHGIASGLVTMLVKNIIEKEFHKGKNKPLEEVLTIINDRIIFEKGNIENYLTGLLIRINGEKLEIVNAGHPKALLYKAETGEINFVDKEGVNQYGAIGIDGFPVNFQSFTFEMKSGDELILYTDGITEAENSEEQYFGTQGIIDTINAYKNEPLDHQVNEIYNSLTAFTNKKNLDDDITYVILRKK